MLTVNAYIVTDTTALMPGDKIRVIESDTLRFDHYCRSNDTLYFMDSAGRTVTHPSSKYNYMLVMRHDVYEVGEEVIVYDDLNEPIENRAFIMGWNDTDQMYYVAIVHENSTPVIALVNTNKLCHKED